MNIVSILGKISIWIIIVPFIFGAINMRKLGTDSRVIFLIVLSGLFPQVLRPFIKNKELLNFLYNIYTLIEFYTLWLLFSKRLKHQPRKIVANTIAILFTISAVYFILDIGVRDRFINEIVIVNNIFQIFMVSLCLLELFFDDTTSISLRQPFFWYITAIASYASCTAVFFGLWYFIKNNESSELQILNLIHHIFNILLYTLLTVGFYVDLRNHNLSKIGRI